MIFLCAPACLLLGLVWGSLFALFLVYIACLVLMLLVVYVGSFACLLGALVVCLFWILVTWLTFGLRWFACDCWGCCLILCL